MSNFWKKIPPISIYYTPTKLKLLQKSQSTSFIVTSLISHICKEMYPLLSLFISYFFVYLWVFLLLLILFLSFLHSKGDPFLIVGTKPLFILFYFFFLFHLNAIHVALLIRLKHFEKLWFVSLNSFLVCERSKKLTPFFYHFVNGLSLQYKNNNNNNLKPWSYSFALPVYVP